MENDDLEAPKTRPRPKDLEVLSIEALNDYVEELEAEIGRVRVAIKVKQAARSGAEQAFKP